MSAWAKPIIVAANVDHLGNSYVTQVFKRPDGDFTICDYPTSEASNDQFADCQVVSAQHAPMFIKLKTAEDLEDA